MPAPLIPRDVHISHEQAVSEAVVELGLSRCLVPYADVAAASGVPLTETEPWIARALMRGVVTGRLDAVRQMLLVFSVNPEYTNAPDPQAARETATALMQRAEITLLKRLGTVRNAQSSGGPGNRLSTGQQRTASASQDPHSNGSSSNDSDSGEETGSLSDDRGRRTPSEKQGRPRRRLQ